MGFSKVMGFSVAALASQFLVDTASAATINEAGFGFQYSVSDGVEEVSFDSNVTAVTDSLSGPRFGTTQFAAVRGDLSTGEIGLSTGILSDEFSGGNASIRMRETITLDLTGFASTDILNFAVESELDGMLGTSPRFSTNAVVRSITLTANALDGSGNSGGLSASVQGFNSQGLNESFSVVGTPSGTFSEVTFDRIAGDLSLLGGSIYDVEIDQTLLGVGQTDFLGTQTFSFGGPVSFTSRSGVFLTAGDTAVAPVPLPGTLSFVFAGLLSLVSFRKFGVNAKTA